MIAVFAVFGTLSVQQFKQLAVGLAFSVLVDATVIRAVLLPSVMALLGDRNWYLPKWLAGFTAGGAGPRPEAGHGLVLQADRGGPGVSSSAHGCSCGSPASRPCSYRKSCRD
jgi:hypothetical protein